MAVLASASSAQARPEFEWVVKGGGSFDDVGFELALDAAGNTYVTGRFEETATFGTTTLTSSGFSDAFVAKLGPKGSFEWAVKGGGSSSDAGVGVAVDAAGNSYVTGDFRETATFGSTTLTSSGDRDVFVAKLGSNGSFEWAVKGGGAFDDYGVDVAVDAAGNGYVTGRFQGTATFGPTTLTSSGSFDVFVAKLASNGNFEWAVKGGGSTFDAGSSVAVDADGNSYVTGYFEETAAFGSITLTSAGDQDVFVAKLASNGSFEWAVKGGGSTFDAGSGVAVDAAGNVYVTGRFDGAATFGSTILTSSGLRDVFVAKLASNGSFAWAVKAGSSSDDTSNDVVVDTAGNSYVTGVFQGTATFGSTTLTSSGWFDAFAAKLASNGIFEWAVKGGGSSLDGGTGVAVDAAGNSYLTGAFQGTATFGSNTLTSSGDRDVFVAQLSAATVVPEDVNEDGVVDFGDVLVILAEWGLCDGCREDIDGSGAVDFTDLLVVLSAWG